MYDDIRTNTGYKYSYIERNIVDILAIIGLGLFMLLNFNWMQDANDRNNFCNSILPTEGFDNYQKNKLENDYCYGHLEKYNYQDRYFDIPPRDYK